MTSNSILPATPQDIDIEKLSEDELRALVKSQLAIIESKKKLGINFTYEPDTSREVQNLGRTGVVPHLVKKPALSTLTSFGAEDHILIEGDNLPAVTAYLAAGGCLADVIYIDPPYNTGNDGSDGTFVYNDNFVKPDSPYYHSYWLSFMLPRLVLGRDGLRETGVIMVAIGQDEVHRLRMLMDEVFGEENFIAMVTWGGSTKASRFVSNTSDYMLVYAKNRRALTEADVLWRAQKPGGDEILQAASAIWTELTATSAPSKQLAFEATKLLRKWFNGDSAEAVIARSYKGNKSYLNVDECGDVYSSGDLAAPDRPETRSRRPLTHPNGKATAVPEKGWRHKDSTLDRLLAEKKVLFGADETTVPRFKRLLKEYRDAVLRDIILRDRATASDELAAMLGRNENGDPLFNNPKDRYVLAEWIDYVTPQFRKDESATDPIVVMDFFAGSGTTGHAVLQLNGQDDVRRKFVLITNNEDPKSDDEDSDTGVARDVTSVRLRAAITGKWADGKEHETYSANLHYYKQDWLSLGPDRFERATLFQGRFAGLAAVASGAHWTADELREVDMDVPATHPDMSVLRSAQDGGTTLVIWKNHSTAADDSGEGFDDEPSGIIRDFLEGNTDKRRIVYIPTTKDKAPFEAEGATETRAFPTEYLAHLDAMVTRLVSDAGLNFG